MKVEGIDILSDFTERTSRNLKTVAAIVIAISWFDVPVDDLQVLNVKLPGDLFNVVSFVVIGYLMVILVIYWTNDFLLWRNGPILATKKEFDRYADKLVEVFDERSQHPEMEQKIRFLLDGFSSVKVEALRHQRSLGQTTWWVHFVIIVLHLILSLLLGSVALAVVLLGSGG